MTGATFAYLVSFAMALFDPEITSAVLFSCHLIKRNNSNVPDRPNTTKFVNMAIAYLIFNIA
ncbi:MAG: hypothetical protein AAFO95_12640 [Cyanobacteria bacterium J06600_6]